MTPHDTNRLNRQGNTVISPAKFRVYLLICNAADAGIQLSLREISKRMGWTSTTSAAKFCLKSLKDAGLISRGEPGQARTIRPLYRVRLFKEPTNGETT